MNKLPLNNILALSTAVRNARKTQNLTQSQLALSAGVGLRFMVELEAGKPTLRLDAVLRVVQALGGQLSIDGLPESPAARSESVA